MLGNVEPRCYYWSVFKYSTSSSWKVHTAAQQSEFRFYSHIHLCLTNKLHYIPHRFQPRGAAVLPPLNLRVLRFLPSIIFICAAFETEQMCFAMYRTYCEVWQWFSFHSCLQLPGDGAKWTKTVFHWGLTGSCESIYSLTAMRQNGPCKRRTCSQRPAHCESTHSVLSHLVHSLHNVFL